jgi:replication factor C large subunit
LSEVKKSIRNCEKNIDEIFWWVEQNISNEYEDPREVAAAFEFLSKADMFREKVFKTRNYRLKNYMLNMIASVSLAKKTPYRKFVSYKPPDRLILLGRTKASRNKMNEVYGKLAKNLHCSKRKIRKQMPFLKIILDSYPEIGFSV